MSLMVRILVGVVAGGLLGGAGLWLGNAAETSGAAQLAAASTTSAAAADEPEWIPGGGIRFASTVLHPAAMALEDGVAEFAYELVPLGARSGELPVVLPEEWVLRTRSGDAYMAATPPPQARSDGTAAPVAAAVRFTDLPATVGRVDLVEVAVVGWRVAVPVETELEMPSRTGSSVRLHDGTTITLATTIEQDSGTILDFDVTVPPDVWRETEQNPFGRSNTFRGGGPGWLSAASTIAGTGGGGGSTGFQLRWSERTVPASIRIVYTTVAWAPLDATVVVGGEALDG